MRFSTALLILFGLPHSKSVPETIFDFFPDQDNRGLFSTRIPISALTVTGTELVAHLISAKIENERGYICAKELDSPSLEIRGLPCSQCKTGKLYVIVEEKTKNGTTLSKKNSTLSDESRRAAICSLQTEKRKQGEDLVVTSPKQNPEDGCRWVFRDAGGSVGCCYSNRDYYTQSGGCDPRMQSLACRKGSERLKLVEEENSCTLHINDLRPADSGNYLSNFQYDTPGFKKILSVENLSSAEGICSKCENSTVLIIATNLFTFVITAAAAAVITVLIVQRIQARQNLNHHDPSPRELELPALLQSQS